MKHFGALVWGGLILNILLFFVSVCFNFIPQEILDELSYAEREQYEVISFISVPFGIAVLLQILSLFLLSSQPKLSYILAIIGAVVMVPAGLIFYVGYSTSYHNFRNKNFKVFEQEPTDVGLNFKTSKFALLGGLFLVGGVVLFMLGSGMSFLLITLGVVYLVNVFRLENKMVIGIRDDNELIITPDMYAKTYLIPLQNLVLVEESGDKFKLRARSECTDVEYKFRRDMILDENSAISLKEILSKLARQEPQANIN